MFPMDDVLTSMPVADELVTSLKRLPLVEAPALVELTVPGFDVIAPVMLLFK